MIVQVEIDINEVRCNVIFASDWITFQQDFIDYFKPIKGKKELVTIKFCEKDFVDKNGALCNGLSCEFRHLPDNYTLQYKKMTFENLPVEISPGELAYLVTRK